MPVLTLLLAVAHGHALGRAALIAVAAGRVSHQGGITEKGSFMRSVKRLAAVAVTSCLGMAVLAAPAVANYYNWGVLYVYEGSTLVAKGKGTVGVDYGYDVIGGHVTSYDSRPGGSPAYAKIRYAYTVPNFNGPWDARGNNNYTATWVDKFVNGNLNTTYSAAELRGEACQDDKWGPDACKAGSWTNQKW